MAKLTLPKIKTPKLRVPNFRKFNGMTVLALLSYIHILVLIPMVFGKKSEFISFHVRQGLLLLAFWVLFIFSLYIPILPWLFLVLIAIGIVFGIIYVLTGKERPMPIIGRLAVK